MEQRIEIKYNHYTSLQEMNVQQQELIKEARKAAERSISPFSHFAVGAAARLASGKIIHGTNIESDVFPAGICAERALLCSYAALQSDDPIVAIAITSTSTDKECYPCGLCRQALLDAERRQKRSIEIVMAGTKTATSVQSAQILLPFTFKL